MRIAIISETPFQLFNSINIICSLPDNTQTDLYISCYLTCMRKCANRIIENKWINGNIYLIEPAKGKIDRCWNYILRGINPKIALKKSILNKKIDIKHIKYDYIYMGCPNPLAFNLANAFKGTEVVFYEEGTGSYHGKIGSSIMSNRLKILQLLTNKGPEKIDPIKQLVYEPSLCRSEYNSEIKQLPKISVDSLVYERLKKIFPIEAHVAEMYQKKRIVYLGQPQYPNYKGDYLKKIRTIEKELELYSNEVLFRPHPSDKEEKEEFYNDTSRSQWEMLCGTVEDNQVLIGICSSAQFTPKYVFDKEPILIFTLLLFEDYCPPNVKSEFIKMIEDIKYIYRDEKKIMSPRNIEELKKILMELHFEN